MSTAPEATDTTRMVIVQIRCNDDEVELLDALTASHGVTSRSEVLRMGLYALARQGRMSRPQLVRAAFEALKAALARPDDAGNDAGPAEAPPAPAPAGCDFDPGGVPCGRPAEWAVRTAEGLRRLCTECLDDARCEDRRFRRNKARPIGGKRGE